METVIINGEPDYIEWTKDAITVNNINEAFNAIVKLKSPDGKRVKYAGIEKPISVSAGTGFNEATWVVPIGEQGILRVADNWEITAVYSADGNLDWSAQSLTVTGNGLSKSIIRMENTVGERMYIGVEIM